MSRSTSPALSHFRLVVHRPGKSSIEHALEDGRSVFLGKSASCGINIEGDGVAEIHCLVDVEGETVSVQDWASDAGTVVNGTNIDDKTALNVGDEIMLGSLRIEVVGQALPKPTPAKVESPVSVKATLPIDTELSSESEAQVDTDSFEPEFTETPQASFDDESEPESALTLPFEDPAASLDQDYDWDPADVDDEIDPEVVALLRAEIDDLRMQLAERDEQLATLSGENDCSVGVPMVPATTTDFAGSDLADRVDALLAELEEHDDRVATLQDLLQAAEVQNQAERDERACLETWVSEIEQRVTQRESELKAEHDALRERLEATCAERDKLQQLLHSAKKRMGGKTVEEELDDETLKELQRRNADLHSQLDEAQKQVAGLSRQVEHLKTDEPENVQSLRAELAKEKADVSRIRFQLSKQLEDIGNVPVAKDQPDREFAYKLKTLREHLREIHEEEKSQRDDKPGTLMGRISNLWKRVGDEY
ncbi:FHA domain-containing protein [Rhodopirellula sp. MGV]|uniref:FHA domain-containing protein n=1 Tax=Rhodopirellula sp. MGV TaxID=2023130 RepID=UPI000B96CFB5|nr:FHA domain-containing protein [Rhodopirellula sp. MGV]OYP28332.1 hypothetical protein CGZ80_26300 [Rhodopirellula sp. MGV]PNY38791.1 hypothetical protein C2E31_02495 [Rhodopirellula baltica]